MITKHAKFPWDADEGQVIQNNDFKKAVGIYNNVKTWCEENCENEYIVDNTVYAAGVKVMFKRRAEANKFEKEFNTKDSEKFGMLYP